MHDIEMQSHPDHIYHFDKPTSRAIRSAIKAMSAAKLRVVLNACLSDADQMRAIARTLEVEDKLIILHADAAGEAKRDAFLGDLLSFAQEAGLEDFLAAIARIIEQTALIEEGYRLISQSIDDLPISKRPPERQLAAACHLAAQDFDQMLDLRPRFMQAQDGSFTFGAPVVVERDDGSIADVDSATDAVAHLLGNLVTFLAWGRWSATDAGLDVPILPDPTSEEIEEAGPLLILSSAWERWGRWERQARYWGGTITRREGPDIPEEATGLTVLFEHDRGEGDYFDWVAVERLKHVTAQDHARLLRAGPVPAADPAALLPPEGYFDLGERLATDLVFQGAHLDPADPTTFAGATINEWIRGYTVLRRLAGDARNRSAVPVERHLLRLRRDDLLGELVRSGLNPAAAEAFLLGATFRPRSVDLFDTPLIRQGPDNFLLFGPAAATIDAGRTVLSNLPGLGASLDHKGDLFENQVVRFLKMIGAPVFTPSGTRLGETYQIDALMVWGSTLFLFECKNTAPSALHPTIALDFEQRRIEDIEQVQRLVKGLRAHPDLLIEKDGPDPTGLTIVPVLLYAMPFAKAGSQDGVYSTDFSILTRFFERCDLGHEVSFDSGDPADPIIHREVTEKLWTGERPSVRDFLKVLECPWPLRLIEARTRLQWVYTQLAPYIVARSPDYLAIELSHEEIADFYGLDKRAWQRAMKRAENLAYRSRKKRENSEIIRQTRLARRKRRI